MPCCAKRKSRRKGYLRARLRGEFENLNDSEQDEDIVGVDMRDATTDPKTQHIARYRSPDKMYIATSVSRLLNNVGNVFRGKFADNPKHGAQVDRKLRLKMFEKDQAHGIRSG